MSTKSLIISGKDFKLYRELAEDDDCVYLRLNNIEFTVSKNEVIVKIPPDVWEVIKNAKAVDLSLVGKTDDELLKIVEKEVDEQIEENVFYMEYTIEEQISEGMDFYKKKRDRQNLTAEKIKLHETNFEIKMNGWSNV